MTKEEKLEKVMELCKELHQEDGFAIFAQLGEEEGALQTIIAGEASTLGAMLAKVLTENPEFRQLVGVVMMAVSERAKKENPTAN